jgi:flagellar basal body-associated protein FliL
MKLNKTVLDINVIILSIILFLSCSNNPIDRILNNADTFLKETNFAELNNDLSYDITLPRIFYDREWELRANDPLVQERVEKAKIEEEKFNQIYEDLENLSIPSMSGRQMQRYFEIRLRMIAAMSELYKGGTPQTVLPSNNPFVGTRPTYSMFTLIGQVRTTTRDISPYVVVVDMVIGYDENDNAAATELTTRLFELQDFVKVFFKSKLAEELEPENEPRLKQEIMEQLNTRLLNVARVRTILFNQLDVMLLK